MSDSDFVLLHGTDPTPKLLRELESNDALYQFLREDRNSALADAVSLRVRVGQLEAELATQARSAPKPPVDDRNRQAEGLAAARVRDVEAQLRAAETKYQAIEAQAVEARNAADQATSEASILRAALEDAREQLEQTSQWGHQTVAELQQNNGTLQQQLAVLRQQRKLRHKASSRLRWERARREVLRLETQRVVIEASSSEMPETKAVESAYQS